MNFKTIKKAMALALFASCSYSLQAQVSLSGSVNSDDKSPIPFSVIGIKNTFLSTQSNATGKFEFKNLKAGKYVEEEVVVDGHIITSRGPATAFAFAYKLLDVLGFDSSSLKHGMLYDLYR